jgi:hypothetical protein
MHTYLKMRSIGLEAVSQSDKTEADLLHNLLVRVLQNVLQVRQNVLDHGDVVVLHSAAAVGRRFHGCALDIGREEVEEHQNCGETSLFDNSMGVLGRDLFQGLVNQKVSA